MTRLTTWTNRQFLLSQIQPDMIVPAGTPKTLQHSLFRTRMPGLLYPLPQKGYTDSTTSDNAYARRILAGCWLTNVNRPYVTRVIKDSNSHPEGRGRGGIDSVICATTAKKKIKRKKRKKDSGRHRSVGKPYKCTPIREINPHPLPSPNLLCCPSRKPLLRHLCHQIQSQMLKRRRHIKKKSPSFPLIGLPE